MLPSMPIIFCSSRQSSPEKDGTDPEKESNKTSNEDMLQKSDLDEGQYSRRILTNYEVTTFDSFPKDEKECDDELVLLADNSPLSEKRKLLAQGSQPKKKKKLDVSHSDVSLEEKCLDDHAVHLAEAYFSKAKSVLDEQTFQKFIALLSEAVDEPGSAVALYYKIVELLVDYQDLIDDFIGFLHPHQAKECGQFMDYKYFEKCWSFLRKLDANHMNRFINSLEQNTTNRKLPPETLKTSLLPILKGHQYLSDCFLQLLPDEKPPTCSKEDYEDISETSVDDGDWERLRIPEHPERGFCQNCCCKCHTAPSHPFCISCNIKFINGQIYVQHGKVLRFARVTFGDVAQMEMLKKLHPALYSKRRKERKTSTSKSVNSGNKDSGERSEITPLEIKCEPDDVCEKIPIEEQGSGIVDIEEPVVEERQEEEDDYWGEESSGGEKSLDSEITSDQDTSDSNWLIGMLPPVSPLANTQDYSISQNVKVETINKTDLVEPQVIAEIRDECDQITKDENIVFTITKRDVGKIKDEIIVAPVNKKDVGKIKDEHTVSSGSKEFIEKIDEANKISNEECKEWTREEDKMILQAFQKEIGTEQTFSKISNLMPSRSMDDIQGRFKVLMRLLEKMASGSQDTYPM